MLRTTSLTLLLAAAATGQGIVSPAHYTNAEGNTWANNGIGTTQSPSNLLSIHDEFMGTPRTIQSVAFRRDGQTTSFNEAPASLLVNIWMSTAATTASTPDATFANNHGANKAQVSSFSLVQFPASTFTGPASPFVFRLPLSQPYSFDGMGPLCVEIQVTSRTQSQNNYFDWVSGQSTNPSILTRQIGKGCIESSQTSPMLLSASGTPNWPNNAVQLNYSGQRMPANALVTAVIGANNQMVAGLPLPFELPGTMGAPSGPCTIYNDVLVALPALTNASGQLTFNIGFPVNPYYNGLSVYSQVLAVDAAANPWGLVVSNGVEHHLVAPYPAQPVGTVYANNSTGPTGTARANQGFVMHFGL